MIAPLRTAARRSRFAPTLALAAVLVFSAGCQIIPEPAADPTRFFVLTVPDRAPVSAPEGSLRLGLRAVELPAYLKSRSLVVRNGRNEIAYQDYARWAEALDEGIARVLRARLVSSPAVARVYSHPFPFDRARDFDIGVSVIRCEGTRGADGDVARFAAVVEIVESATGNVLSRRAIAVPDQPWDGTDPAALVEALSTAVGRLADDVVAQLPGTTP
jgi:uncharacterized lipoprotein YmbA